MISCNASGVQSAGTDNLPLGVLYAHRCVCMCACASRIQPWLLFVLPAAHALATKESLGYMSTINVLGSLLFKAVCHLESLGGLASQKKWSLRQPIHGRADLAWPCPVGIQLQGCAPDATQSSGRELLQSQRGRMTVNYVYVNMDLTCLESGDGAIPCWRVWVQTHSYMHPQRITLSSADVFPREQRNGKDPLRLIFYGVWVYSAIPTTEIGSYAGNDGSPTLHLLQLAARAFKLPPFCQTSCMVEIVLSVGPCRTRVNMGSLHRPEVFRSHSVPSERGERSILQTKSQAQPSARR